MRIDYPTFRHEFLPFKIFSLSDAQKHFPNFDGKRLSQWKQKNYLQPIIRGHYTFAETTDSQELWWLAANRIFEPSYISLESALDFYGFIPESAFQITSITTRRTQNFQSEHRNFSYRNMKPSHFFGYTLLSWENHQIKIVEPEKALLDFIYLNSKLNSESAFESLRWNATEIIETCHFKRMEKYKDSMENLAFHKRFEYFKKWLNA